MKRPNSVLSSAMFVTIAASALPAFAQDAPLPESDEIQIEYDSVAGAMAALSQMEGVYWRDENGWPIAINESERTIWSFAPADYPAYPAVVKLQVTPNGTGSTITQSILCEAQKDVCDDLVRTFAEMRGLPLPE